MDVETPRPAHRWLVSLVLAGGILFTLHLQTTVREGVFTQGDLAMKFLYTRQLAREGWAPDLRLPGEPWVKDLWRRGLHPFPFAVRRHREREYLYYPVTFPLVSSPLYRAFGWRGLYVLPLASTWLVWLAFVPLARRYGLREPWRAATLAVIIFATPLTFYSATFWEHTLAIALAFPVAAFALSPPPGRPLGAAASTGLGVVMGMGAWFREELLFLCGILILFVAIPDRFRRVGPLSIHRPAFIAGIGAAIGLFVAGNLALYGLPLGLHAVDFVGWLSEGSRAVMAARFLARSLLEHYPMGVAILVLLAVVTRARPWTAAARPAALLLICGAFCVAVPLLARHDGGRQFGPRFLLVVFPLSALAGGLLLPEAARRLSPRVRVAAIVAMALLAGMGVRANAVEAERHLRVNYGRRLLSYEALRRSQPRIVAVSHEFVAQGMAALVGEKTFFLTPSALQLKRLGRELAKHGEARLVYLCYPQYPCGPFSDLPPVLNLSADGAPLLRFERVGDFDRYVMYEGRVLRPRP